MTNCHSRDIPCQWEKVYMEFQFFTTRFQERKRRNTTEKGQHSSKIRTQLDMFDGDVCALWSLTGQCRREWLISLIHGFTWDHVHHHDHHQTVLTEGIRWRYEVHNSPFLVVGHMMFEDELVNYVEFDPWQQTTHSYGSTFLRFRVFEWHFRVPSSLVSLWLPFLDTLGGDTCVVWSHASQLRRVCLIVTNHTFTRHHTHEILCFYVTFSWTELTGVLEMTISRHSWGVSYVMLEGTLVNYVVPVSLSPTTHSHDTTLMRFRRLRWYFMCLCKFWVFIRLQILYKYTGEGSGCETEYMWGTYEDINSA